MTPARAPIGTCVRVRVTSRVMKTLFRTLIVAAMPYLVTLIARQLAARGRPRDDDYPVIEPQQEDPLLPSEVSMSPRRGF